MPDPGFPRRRVGNPYSGDANRGNFFPKRLHENERNRTQWGSLVPTSLDHATGQRFYMKEKTKKKE